MKILAYREIVRAREVCSGQVAAVAVTAVALAAVAAAVALAAVAARSAAVAALLQEIVADDIDDGAANV